MKFLIRDDDPCGFTKPEELISCYEHIWDEIPVNFSVTPFRIPSTDKNVPEELYGNEEVIALADNSELVKLLKSLYNAGKIDFAMHGYNHIKFNGLPEYVGGNDLYNKTKAGKAYLESILECEIHTFVPPNNGVSREGFDAIVSNNMNLIAVPSFLRTEYRPFEASNIVKYLKEKYYFYSHNIKYPYIFDFANHKEVNYVSVTPSQTMDKIKWAFDKCHKLDGVFIFAVHYHAFNKRLKSGELIKDALEEIVTMARNKNNIDYVSYKDLWGNS